MCVDLAREAINFEQVVNEQCQLLLKTDAEFWEIKNKAISKLISVIKKYENYSYENIQEIFGMNIFRILKDPIKGMLGDLRSQQVRDTCTFLSNLSIILGDHMRHFLRDIFHDILNGVKATNKVMSGYVDECILTILKHTTFKAGIPILIGEMSASKSKIVREKCLDYMNEMIVGWDISEKDADQLSEAIKLGLEDASVKGREIARCGYLNMFQIYPSKTEKIKLELVNQALVRRLEKEEAAVIEANETAFSLTPQKVEESLKIEANLSVKAEINIEPTAEELAVPVSPRRPRLQLEDSQDSVNTIPASMRGTLARRQSIAIRPILVDVHDDEGEEEEDTPSVTVHTGLVATPQPDMLPMDVEDMSQKTAPDLSEAFFDNEAASESKNQDEVSPQQHKPQKPPKHLKKTLTPVKRSSASPHASISKVELLASNTVDATIPPAACAPTIILDHDPTGDVMNSQCKAELAGLIKLKVSYMMELLREDLDLAAKLERSQEGGESTDGMANTVIKASMEELQLCRNFEDRVNTLLISHSSFASI